MTSRRSFIQVSLGTLSTVSLVEMARPAGRPHRIGFLGAASASTPGTLRRVEAFRAGLRALGYVEGADVVVEFRWANGDARRLPELARELVRLPVDVLMTQGSSGTRAAKDATSTIPIVMMAVGDAVGAGLVASLARPGGNVTGSTFLGPQIYAKQLELLREAVPRVARVAVLMNPGNPGNRTALRELEGAARSMKVTLTPIDARGREELESAFRAMAAQRVDGVVVSTLGTLPRDIRPRMTIPIFAEVFMISSHDAGGPSALRLGITVARQEVLAHRGDHPTRVRAGTDQTAGPSQ